MNTGITPQQKFEEKILDRLREDIGKLLPDEVLAEMTKKAMEKMFFEPRIEPARNHWDKATTHPSWFEQHIHDALKVRAATFAADWFTENRQRLITIFEDVIRASGPMILAEALFRPVDNAIARTETNLRAAMAEHFQKVLAQIPSTPPRQY